MSNRLKLLAPHVKEKDRFFSLDFSLSARLRPCASRPHGTDVCHKCKEHHNFWTARTARAAGTGKHGSGKY
jgi:hypothetical protein